MVAEGNALFATAQTTAQGSVRCAAELSRAGGLSTVASPALRLLDPAADFLEGGPTTTRMARRLGTLI
ncbi:MAG: hypothetical protein FJZ01_10150 [Candidatus Sericytochromatia bacterium]|nr:hypothetical protein [Candidatus Tanganyikabacteria bacterium]